MRDEKIRKPLKIAMLGGAVITGTKNMLFINTVFCFVVLVDYITVKLYLKAVTPDRRLQ